MGKQSKKRRYQATEREISSQTVQVVWDKVIRDPSIHTPIIHLLKGVHLAFLSGLDLIGAKALVQSIRPPGAASVCSGFVARLLESLPCDIQSHVTRECMETSECIAVTTALQKAPRTDPALSMLSERTHRAIRAEGQVVAPLYVFEVSIPSSGQRLEIHSIA